MVDFCNVQMNERQGTWGSVKRVDANSLFEGRSSSATWRGSIAMSSSTEDKPGERGFYLRKGMVLDPVLYQDDKNVFV